MLHSVRVPDSAGLPGPNTCKDAGRVLVTTRSTWAWAALGHAVALEEAGQLTDTIAGLAKFRAPRRCRP